MIIDATNLIAGRLASVAAKKALLGEDVFIVNAEAALISGKKKFVAGKYDAQAKRGEPFHGPFLPKTPDRFLKRINEIKNFKKLERLCDSSGNESNPLLMFYESIGEANFIGSKNLPSTKYCPKDRLKIKKKLIKS